MRALAIAGLLVLLLPSVAALSITPNPPTPANGSILNASTAALNYSLDEDANCTLSWAGANETVLVSNLSIVHSKANITQGSISFQLFCAAANATNSTEPVLFFAEPPLELRAVLLQPSNSSASDGNATFFPDNDSANDTILIRVNASRAAAFDLEIRDAANVVVKSFTASSALSIEREWNGSGRASYNNGSIVSNGSYLLRIRLTSGNSSLLDATRFLIVGAANASNATPPNATPPNATPTPPAPPSSGGSSGGSLENAVLSSGAGAPEQFCNEAWNCTPWSPCSNGTQHRSCTDSNRCVTALSKPLEAIRCAAPKPIAICDPGKLGCIDDALSRCNGSRWLLVEACEFGCSNNACNPEPTEPAKPAVTGQFLQPGNIAIGLAAAGILLIAFSLLGRGKLGRGKL